MSDRKQEEIDSMFKATNIPKLIIEDIPKITKISVILDNTNQGMNALSVASEMAKKFQSQLDVIISEDFFEAFKSVIESTQEKLGQLSIKAKSLLDKNGLHANIDTVIGGRIEKTMEAFDGEITDEIKLGNKILAKLEEINADILVIGVPLYHNREDNESELLGSYVTKILRARSVHSNVILVSENMSPLGNSLISFVEVSQQPTSIIALTKRALSLSDKDTKLTIVGIVEDKLIETVARIEGEELETLPIQETADKLKQKFRETLDGMVISEGLPNFNITKSVSSGKISEIVSLILKDVTEGLILVRSVAEIQENLDPTAAMITRLGLAAGLPCLVVWD